MNPHAFVEFPKLYRLFRDVIITEKIDGTNAHIYVADKPVYWTDAEKLSIETANCILFAASRNRYLGPDGDNYGFYAWVKANAEALADILGPGRYFGEWYGSGIQRGYGLNHKRFALFNVSRWGSAQEEILNNALIGDPATPPRDYFTEPEALKGGLLTAVPTLARGSFSENDIKDAASALQDSGSKAAPGFNRPEGIVVFHTASGHSYKYTPFNGDGHKARGRAPKEGA